MALDVLVAFLGGLLPSLIWLFYWLMEDRCEPEPKRFIVYAFLAGMISVAPALLLQYYAKSFFTDVGLLLAWATIEEFVKYTAAYFAALRFAVFDEPLDAVVYLIAVSLGFSALENALFLWSPISEGDVLRSIITQDLRFMGATLLHVLTAATMGLSLAISFTKPRATRRLFAILGLILATALHTIFNFFILKSASQETLWVFVCVWVGIVVALLMIERIKQPKDYC